MRVSLSRLSRRSHSILSQICAFSEDDCRSWFQYLTAVAKGEVKSALSAIEGAGASQRHLGVEAREGWLEVSTADGKPGSFTRLWAQLDPASRLLLLFTSEKKETGSERAVVDMLSTDLFDTYPTPDVGVSSAPLPPRKDAACMWLQVEDPANPANSMSVFGRGQLGHTASCSALIAADEADKQRWLVSLYQARGA